MEGKMTFRLRTLFVAMALAACVFLVVGGRFRMLRSENVATMHFEAMGAALVAESHSSNFLFRHLGMPVVRRTKMLCTGTDETCRGSEDAFGTWLRRHYADFGLAHQEITDQDMRYIACMTDLESLSLESRAITHAGLEQLVVCKKLRLLRIGSPLLDDRAVTVFASLPHLTRLELVGTELSPGGIERLDEMKPSLEIVVINRNWDLPKVQRVDPTIMELEALLNSRADR
jgi:hypothetical protein